MNGNKLIVRLLGLCGGLIIYGASFAFNDPQAAVPDSAAAPTPVASPEQIKQVADFSLQATQVSQCRLTDGARLALDSGFITDLNQVIEAQNLIVNDKTIPADGDVEHAQNLEAAKKRLAALNIERASLFDMYKKLGGTESDPSSVQLLNGPCKDPTTKLNSLRHEMLKKRADSAPIVKQAKMVANTCSPPIYPKVSALVGQQGRVVLGIIANKDGAVVDKWVIQSTGFRFLDQSALDAAQTCKLTTDTKIDDSNLMGLTFGMTFTPPK